MQAPPSLSGYYYGPSEAAERQQRRALFASRSALASDLKLQRTSARYDASTVVIQPLNACQGPLRGMMYLQWSYSPLMLAKDLHGHTAH